jgi:hypothetical protein
MKTATVCIAMLMAAFALPSYAGSCGDGVLDRCERCDDGNTSSGDGCSQFCQVECQTDGDCAPGLICDSSRQECRQSCSAHCDCPQGEFCYYGSCLCDPKTPVYCCANPGCPPGRWCFEPSGSKGTCAEDPNYFCSSACDCGPAHCCKNNMCIKDVKDPWNPGGTFVEPGCMQGVDATYCCSDPLCYAGKYAYGADFEDFRCHDLGTDQAEPFCGGKPCHFACDCDPGESCVDTHAYPVPPMGRICEHDGGHCVSNAVAEAVFGYSPADLIPCCSSGCFTGQKCETGWRQGGVYTVERVVGVCGSCGNGTCELDKLETTANCADDCYCGDGICDTTEVGVCGPDCGACGDGVCDPLENPKWCPSDCPVTCGDGSCASVEMSSCPADCGCPGSYLLYNLPVACGDGACQHFGDIPEDCINCPADCEPVTDTDNDGTPDGCDLCPTDALKITPGVCGCGVSDADADSDGTPDCNDNCPSDPLKIEPGQCGCGVTDDDADGDGIADCVDTCPLDPDDDSDGDGLCGNVDECRESNLGPVGVLDG